MKLTSILLLLYGLLFLSSCNDDEFVDLNDVVNGTIDSNIDTSVPIDGSWLLTQFNISQPVDFNQDGTAEPNLITETNCYTNERLVFNQDGTGTSNSSSYLDVSYEIDGNQVISYVAECITENESGSFSWTQEGNIITFTEDNEITQLELNGNELRTTIPNAFFILPVNSEDDIIQQDVSFVFTKQE